MLGEHQHQTVADGLRRGDRQAWAALYDAYCEDVWRYVARLIGPQSADVADVVQETFLAAARSARRYDPARGSLWSWLSGIAHYQVTAAWRASRRANRVVELADAGKLCFGGDDGEVIDELLQRAETSDAVRCVLAQLPADYATLLIAKYLDDHTIEALARDFGCSGEAIKSKLARARREFRTKFECFQKQTTKTA